MKGKIILLVAFFLINFLFVAQVITPFSKVFQVTQKGNIVILANAVMGCSNNPNSSTGACLLGTSEMPPAGTFKDNDFIADTIDIDNDPGTFMSSSDSLNLPSCSDISYAGLFWGAYDVSNSIPNYDIKLKVNNNSYIPISPDSSSKNTGASNPSYYCYKNITSIVTSAGAKARFTVANIPCNKTNYNSFGSWAIVVVYKNDLLAARQLTVFNGLAWVKSGADSVDVPVVGFVTPAAGPVNFELGVYAYETDRSIGGDELQFNGAGTFVGISDALSPANDVFNGTVANKGVLTPYRIPNLNNTASFDADIFAPDNSLKNYIGNADTTCIVRLTSKTSGGGDTYFLQCITTAIDVNEPELRTSLSITDLNGGVVKPGDTLECTIVGKNIGYDASVNTFITDTIDKNIELVPTSINITYGVNSGAKTEAIGDDEAEYNTANRVLKINIGAGADSSNGGFVNGYTVSSDSTVITFKVVANPDCVELLCSNSVNARTFIHGYGNVSSIYYSVGSSLGTFDLIGCPIPGSMSFLIDASGCVTPPDDSTCSTTPFAISMGLQGYNYYDDVFTQVSAPDKDGKYFAIRNIGGGCIDTVIIHSIIFCELEIPNVFTPNSDGVNDKFIVRAIELFPYNVLTIYDRWGSIVFHAAPYKNNWDGSTNSGINFGKDKVSDGTYYYILDSGKPKIGIKKGTVFLIR